MKTDENLLKNAKTSDWSGESPSSTGNENIRVGVTTGATKKNGQKKQLVVSNREGLQQTAGKQNCDSVLGWLNRCTNATFLRFM